MVSSLPSLFFHKSLFLHAVNLPMRSLHHDRKYSPPEASKTRHGRCYLTLTTIHHCHPVVMVVILWWMKRFPVHVNHPRRLHHRNGRRQFFPMVLLFIGNDAYSGANESFHFCHYMHHFQLRNDECCIISCFSPIVTRSTKQYVCCFIFFYREGCFILCANIEGFPLYYY